MGILIVFFERTSGLPVTFTLGNQYLVNIPTQFLKAVGVKKVTGTFSAAGSSSTARNSVALGVALNTNSKQCFYLYNSNPIPTGSYTFTTSDFTDYQYLVLTTATSNQQASILTFE